MEIVTICIPYDLFAQITYDTMRPEHVTPEAMVEKIVREHYAKRKED